MSSLLPGYHYDIFVSYRHKDNLPTPGFGRQASDSWVTEFVKTLRSELEATFKEDISIRGTRNSSKRLPGASCGPLTLYIKRAAISFSIVIHRFLTFLTRPDNKH